MEHCYRITLWMFCIIACIQAMPRPKRSSHDDLRLNFLHQAECGNMTFNSSATEANTTVAINCVFYELKKASTNCTDVNQRINQTLDTIEYNYDIEKAPFSCPWTATENFTKFVEDIKSVFERAQA